MEDSKSKKYDKEFPYDTSISYCNTGRIQSFFISSKGGKEGKETSLNILRDIVINRYLTE